MPQLNQQLKTYLAAIPKNRFDSEFYTPTQLLPLTAKASRARPAFDEASQGDESTEQLEFKAQQVDVLEGLWQYAVEKPREKTDKPLSSHVLLIGKPGSGKSTALHQLFQEAVQKALVEKRYDHPEIPVLIELRSIPHPRQKEDVWTWIQDAIEEQAGLKLPIEALKQWQNWLLLFDGLNEAAFETLQSLHSFLQRPIVSAIPTICTTRQLGAENDLRIRTRLEMLPLNESQMREFVQKYLPEYGDVLLGQLQGHLQEIAETPLLLKMLCDVFKETQQIPQNKSELFQEFDRQYSSFKGSTLVDPDLRRHKSELLQYLAFKMLEGDPDNPTGYWLRVERSTAERWLEEFLAGRVEAPGGKAKKWLEGLQAHYLLQEADKNRYEVEFHHQLFQEYYAAEWLSPQLAGMSDEVLKCHYMNYLKWTEPLMMALALVESKKLAVRLVELALEVDWSLGAKLAGSVKPKFQDNVINLVNKHLNNLSIPSQLKIEILAKTCTPCVVKYLNIFLGHDDIDIRYKAVKALGDLGTNIPTGQVKLILGKLFHASEDPEPRIRSHAAFELGSLGNREAVPILIAALDDKDPGVREDIIHALGKLQDKAAIPSLSACLDDPNSKIREKAIEALEKIGTNNSTLTLCLALRDQEASVRASALKALTRINDNLLEEINTVSTITSLSHLLEDQDSDARALAAKVLIKLGNEISVPYLLNALKSEFEEDYGLRLYSVQALGRIGVEISSTEVFEAIEEGLEKATWPNSKDEPSDVLVPVALALAEIGSQDAFYNLLNALTGASDKEAPRVITALKKLDISGKLEHLERSLNDTKDPILNCIKAKRIGILCAVDQEAFHGLREALKLKRHSSFKSLNPRYKAIEGLWSVSHLNLDQKKAVPILCEALHDENEAIRKAAISALSRMNIRFSTRQLIEALHITIKDENKVVRARSIEVLGRVSGVSAIPRLLEALNDNELFVQRQAIEMLGKIGDKSIVPELVAYLENEDQWIRREAIYALEKIGGTESILGLVQALKDPHGSNQISADGALHRLCIEKKSLNLISDTEKKSITLKLLEMIRSVERDIFFATLAAVLGEIGDSLAVQTLVDTLKHKKPDFHQHAAHALGKIGDKLAIPHLLEALEKEEVSIQVINALAKICRDDSISFLEKAIELEKFNKVRCDIAIAIAKIGTERAAKSIHYLIDGSEPNFRLNICKALHAISRSSKHTNCNLFVNQLLKCSVDQNHMIRFYAIGALHCLSKKGVNLHFLPELKNTISTLAVMHGDSTSVRDALRVFEVFTKIQASKQIYNYAIYQQSKIVPFSLRSPKMSEAKYDFRGAVFNAPPAIGDNPTLNYTQNNYNTEQNFEVLLADYKSFISDLQSRHQGVATEQEAIQIIDAEIKSTPHWRNLLEMKRLLNGSKQAAIAVGEHFAESNVFGKAAISFFEGVAENPN